MMKTKWNFGALSRSAPLLVILGAMTLGVVGCGASKSAPDLKITSINQNQTWQQGFTQAWMNRSANGEFDVVLVDQASEQAMAGTAITAPVRQVMHIRVLWSPTRDMKAVVSNASVKWYVIGRSQPQNVLEYTGIAFVNVDEDENGATLRIRNAVLNPSGKRCQLTDPVGPSRLEGTFVARKDVDTVNKVLSGVKDALTAAATGGPAPVAEK